MTAADAGAKPGHGDHWLAVLDESDPRLRDVLATPARAPERATLHRLALTEAVDLVQVTSRGRLVTAYPEPRATTLVTLRPRELALWSTGAEGWLVADHEGAGTLTIFITDLIERADRYQKAPRELELEVSAIAYQAQRADGTSKGPSRLTPAARTDARFLPDDYAFVGDVLAVRPAGTADVVDLALHGGLHVPVVVRDPVRVSPGERLEGFLWLTGRCPPS